MNDTKSRPSSKSWQDANLVLRRLLPLAYSVFLAGYIASAALFSLGRAPRLEDGIMSDLLSRTMNPRGYLLAAGATVVFGLLMLPATAVFRRAGRGVVHRVWAGLAAWLYRVGLVAAIAVGISSPFEEPYTGMHLRLTYLAFMSITAGAAVGLVVTACSSVRGGRMLSVLATLHVVALGFVTYLYFTPEFFDDRRWLLAVCEWAVIFLVGVGTVVLTAAMAAPIDVDSSPEGLLQ
jgi:hypothetical protein